MSNETSAGVGANPTSIVDRTERILMNQYGAEIATSFRNKLVTHFGSNTPNLEGLQDGEQIRLMNRFWDSVLAPLPNTTETRAWLEDCNNMSEYLADFSRVWSKDVIASGALR